MLDFEFMVEQTSEDIWVITVCPPFGESIRLAGAFKTEHAARAALARNRSRWTDDPQGQNQSPHGLRVIDGGQSASALSIDISDRPRCSSEKGG